MLYHRAYSCKVTTQLCKSPEEWCIFCSMLFLTPDWGGDQGLPGLPADCVWRVRLHFQTQPVHETREVPGGSRCLGPSRKGDRTSSCFSPSPTEDLRWRSAILSGWEFLTHVTESKIRVMCQLWRHFYCNESVRFYHCSLLNQPDAASGLGRCKNHAWLSRSGAEQYYSYSDVDTSYFMFLTQKFHNKSLIRTWRVSVIGTDLSGSQGSCALVSCCSLALSHLHLTNTGLVPLCKLIKARTMKHIIKKHKSHQQCTL